MKKHKLNGLVSHQNIINPRIESFNLNYIDLQNEWPSTTKFADLCKPFDTAPPSILHPNSVCKLLGRNIYIEIPSFVDFKVHL